MTDTTIAIVQRKILKRISMPLGSIPRFSEDAHRPSMARHRKIKAIIIAGTVIPLPFCPFLTAFPLPITAKRIGITDTAILKKDRKNITAASLLPLPISAKIGKAMHTSKLARHKPFVLTFCGGA